MNRILHIHSKSLFNIYAYYMFEIAVFKICIMNILQILKYCIQYYVDKRTCKS